MDDFSLEGDLIRLRDGAYFEVKGFSHPSNGVVAFPRYIPSNIILKKEMFPQEKISPRYRRSEKDREYRKIYDIGKKFQILQKLYTSSIPLKHPNYSFSIPQVPNHLIQQHLHPEDVIDLYSKRFHNNSQSTPTALKEAIKFCQHLSDVSGVSLNNFGITGSCLGGLDQPSSDIDIIIYGYDAASKIREYIYAIFSQSSQECLSQKIRQYTSDELPALYSLRVPEKHISMSQFAQMELRKLHQGFYNGREFFIRYFEFDSRDIYARLNPFETQTIIGLGRISLSAQVIEDYHWWTTPSKIMIANINILDTSSLIPSASGILSENKLKLTDIGCTFTLRGRFTENARLLERVHIFGTLELVTLEKSKGKPDEPLIYLQIVLGNHPKDVLLPI
ncbi:MAG: hypothetical protein ACTSRK_04450 [Promethearchaeota archaeon]